MTLASQTTRPAASAETVHLRDGGRLCLRPVQPSDKASFLRAFDGLSSQSRYRRFLAHKRELSKADLVYFTEVDGDSHFALVAVAPDPKGGEGELVGVARYIRLEADVGAAEIAVTVVDSHQRRGIGKLLLERLIHHAHAQGIRGIRVHLLAENLPVRKLLEGLFGEHGLERDGEVISGEIRLQPPETREQRPQRAPLFELLRLAAEEAVLPINLSLISSRARFAALKSRLSSPSSISRRISG